MHYSSALWWQTMRMVAHKRLCCQRQGWGKKRGTWLSSLFRGKTKASCWLGLATLLPKSPSKHSWLIPDCSTLILMSTSPSEELLASKWHLFSKTNKKHTEHAKTCFIGLKTLGLEWFCFPCLWWELCNTYLGCKFLFLYRMEFLPVSPSWGQNVYRYFSNSA